MSTAKISEIFESVQGEGIYLGSRHLFIRFFGCPLSCAFCDTPQDYFKEYGPAELRDEIIKYQDYEALALTGGEPLCQADFLRDFLSGYSGLGPKVYLETNGVLAGELAKVLDWTDIIAMDFKLPSWTRAGSYWKEHESFLKIAVAKEVFVKMVITCSTEASEVLTAGAIIQKIKSDIHIVLQPNWAETDIFLLERMRDYKRLLLESGLKEVKILPQAHKYAGVK